MDKKVKVTNPNKHKVGIKFMDGMREQVVHPNSFIILDANEIYFINNMSKLFSKKHLIIEDSEINQDLGFEEKTVVALSNGDIEKMLKGNFMKMKSELDTIEEKHVKDRIISIAKEIDDLARGKIEFLAKWSGYGIDQFIESDDEE